MQRQEAAFGGVCKSLNLKKKKKSRWMGGWVVGREEWEIKEEKGGRGRDKSYLFSSSPPFFLLYLPVIPFFNGVVCMTCTNHQFLEIENNLKNENFQHKRGTRTCHA